MYVAALNWRSRTVSSSSSSSTASVPVAPPSGAGFADPGPLGLAGFAATTFFLSVVNTNMVGASVTSAVFGLALFYGGIFIVTQKRGVTQLALSEALAACPSAKRASAAAVKKKKPKSRSLWGDGHGAFRTSGQYSAATVRGTNWFTKDSCDGTLTKVKSGVVEVNDFVRHKKLLLRKGKSYVARPRRR